MSSQAVRVNDLSSSIDAFLRLVDTSRLNANQQLEECQKAELGQFFTPMSVARLMASMLVCSEPIVSLCDPCAGVGSLFAACIAELCLRPNLPREIHVTAYEIDAVLVTHLQNTLELCNEMCGSVGVTFTGEVRHTDFIESAVAYIKNDPFTPMQLRPINCIILNPPYRKLQTGSAVWKLLQRGDIKTTNLYTGFLSLCMKLLKVNGEMVAITPRSFCSGSYFKPFREAFLDTMALQRLHLFESRDHAFREDGVLQETMIFSAVKSSATPATVLVTGTTGPNDTFVTTRNVPYNEVIAPSDPQSCIRIVSDESGQQIARRMAMLEADLASLDISVSTGRVVDFRAEAFLRFLPEEGTVPLIYPTHITSGSVVWPKLEAKKACALVDTEQTHGLLVPNEHYVLVRRFSAKEEKRRVVAVLYEPQALPGAHVGFENHLNYFHHNTRGLDPLLAKGLTVFLNSTLVDLYIRSFNGHTQVNATDLRNMRYPRREQLEQLGELLPDEMMTQDGIDGLIEEILFSTKDQSRQVRVPL
ncbi:MAG: Eco57I restriction-modification methylase domain-containing protein [Chloroflexi bacterium]|nr:Eco57I restriction-modification methylase domain-containing protein [Chloroflexota bacterium]